MNVIASAYIACRLFMIPRFVAWFFYGGEYARFVVFSQDQVKIHQTNTSLKS